MLQSFQYTQQKLSEDGSSVYIYSIEFVLQIKKKNELLHESSNIKLYSEIFETKMKNENSGKKSFFLKIYVKHA